MKTLLDQAACCPTCQSPPRVTDEEVLGNMRKFLRCPKDHPYVASGETLLKAIDHWNYYIAYQTHADAIARDKQSDQNNSYCPYCKHVTASILRFERHKQDMTAIQQCGLCKLIKSERDAA